jgi:hypothetical protein
MSEMSVVLTISLETSLAIFLNSLDFAHCIQRIPVGKFYNLARSRR